MSKTNSSAPTTAMRYNRMMQRTGLVLLLLSLTASCFSPPPLVRVDGRKRNGSMAKRSPLNEREEPLIDDVEVESQVQFVVGEPAATESKPWWKKISLKPVKSAVSSVKTKIQSFWNKSDFEDQLFSELRNTTFAQSLQKKYYKPDTSAARVQIFCNDFVMDGEGNYDIDKVLVALQNLNNLLLRNGTVWELAQEFTGSWTISTTNTTLQDFNITLFPSLIIPNLSMALLDPDNVELVKLFGEFEANAMTKKLEFRFNEMAILGIRSTLPKERAFPFNKPPSVPWRKATTSSATTTTNATDDTNKKRPFQQAIPTNETADGMKDVLSWCDDWYDQAISDEI